MSQIAAGGTGPSYGWMGPGSRCVTFLATANQHAIASTPAERLAQLQLPVPAPGRSAMIDVQPRLGGSAAACARGVWESFHDPDLGWGTWQIITCDSDGILRERWFKGGAVEVGWVIPSEPPPIGYFLVLWWCEVDGSEIREILYSAKLARLPVSREQTHHFHVTATSGAVEIVAVSDAVSQDKTEPAAAAVPLGPVPSIDGPEFLRVSECVYQRPDGTSSSSTVTVSGVTTRQVISNIWRRTPNGERPVYISRGDDFERIWDEESGFTAAANQRHNFKSTAAGLFSSVASRSGSASGVHTLDPHS